MANPHHEARDGKGNYARRLATAERDAATARAYERLRNYQKVADECGYSNRGDAWRAVQRCRNAVIQEAGAELIASEAQQLDDLFVAALEVLERDHVTVSHGKVVKDDDGKPLLDDGPKLAAIDRLVKVRESYRKLLGIDAAQKIDVAGAVRYEVVGVDPEDLT